MLVGVAYSRKNIHIPLCLVDIVQKPVLVFIKRYNKEQGYKILVNIFTFGIVFSFLQNYPDVISFFDENISSFNADIMYEVNHF